MRRHTIALTALLAVALSPASAQALELGVQDDGRASAAVTQDCVAIECGWTRTTVSIGQPGVAQRIRDAHAAGQKIILTVGGTGTHSRRPSFVRALRYIRSLPRADKYTIDNEPDLDGVKPCAYRKGWMHARRVLGRRLLWGDLSPHRPLTFTQRARACGPLPKRLDVAIHPYQDGDPLAKGDPADSWLESEGGFSNLGFGKRWLRKNAGVRVTWWITEFGYVSPRVADAQAAWLWPRALKQATRQKARVLIAYTAQGGSWDTRPRALAWCSLTRGRACPGAQRPVEHREPIKQDDDEQDGHVRHLDPVVQQMLEYASA